MNVNTIHVEALATARDKQSLGDSIQSAVQKFLETNEGKLIEYDVSGTQLQQGPYGQALVTIKWEDDSKGKKK